MRGVPAQERTGFAVGSASRARSESVYTSEYRGMADDSASPTAAAAPCACAVSSAAARLFTACTCLFAVRRQDDVTLAKVRERLRGSKRVSHTQRGAAHARTRLQRGVQREVDEDADDKERIVAREGQRIELRHQRCGAGEHAQPCDPRQRGSSSACAGCHRGGATTRTNLHIADKEALRVAGVNNHLCARLSC